MTAQNAGAAVLAPGWARRLRAFNETMMFDLLGGPRPWKLSWVIDAQKVGTFPLLALLMWYCSGRTPATTAPAAWIYVAMHGAYGLVRHPNYLGEMLVYSSFALMVGHWWPWLVPYVL